MVLARGHVADFAVALHGGPTATSSASYEEVAHRTQTRLQRLTRKAGFPFLKTIDDFDFTLQSTLLGSFPTPDFVTDGR